MSCKIQHTVTFNESGTKNNFDVELILNKKKKCATIDFPSISFTSNGGNVSTICKKLPKEFRPCIDLDFNFTSYDSFVQSFPAGGPVPSSLPIYKVTITHCGDILISGPDGTLPVGTHNLVSRSVDYFLGKITRQTLVFQQLDGGSIAFPDPLSNVNVLLWKRKKYAYLQFPSISVISQSSLSPDNNTGVPAPMPGGYIATVPNMGLCEKYRPTVDKSFPFSETSLYPSYYLNLSINIHGRIRIGGSGYYDNSLPPGQYLLNAGIVKYYVGKQICSKNNDKMVDPRFVDISQFTGPHASRALNDGIRDQHVNDNYKDIIAETWTGNLDQPDKTIPVMDLYVRVSHKSSCGKKIKGKLINLTKFAPLTSQPVNGDYVFCWSTAISINKQNPNVITASSMLININGSTAGAVPIYFVSNDKGKTWSGINYLDPVTFPKDNVSRMGDCRGVTADEDGNFWYVCSKRLANFNINPYIYFSGDFGATWQLAYKTVESIGAGPFFDYQQIATGPDGTGRRGLWCTTSFYDVTQTDSSPCLIFIPVNGHTLLPTGNGTFGDGNMQIYPSLENTMLYPSIAIGCDGTVYFAGYGTGDPYDGTTIYLSYGFVKKLPPKNSVNILDASLISPTVVITNVGGTIGIPLSYPGFGYNEFSVQGIIRDDKNKVLLASYTDIIDPNSQNINMYMKVSFNDGATWSSVYNVSSSNINNRGYKSMAFYKDTVSLTWYDGRNDPTGTRTQFWDKYIDESEYLQLLNDAKQSSN